MAKKRYIECLTFKGNGGIKKKAVDNPETDKVPLKKKQVAMPAGRKSGSVSSE